MSWKFWEKHTYHGQSIYGVMIIQYPGDCSLFEILVKDNLLFKRKRMSSNASNSGRRFGNCVVEKKLLEVYRLLWSDRGGWSADAENSWVPFKISVWITLDVVSKVMVKQLYPCDLDWYLNWCWNIISDGLLLQKRKLFRSS